MSRKANIFTDVPQMKVPRNMFDLSHEVKMSGKFGYLYPVLCKEALPGDTWRDQMVAQIRFAPMLAPIMHRVDVKVDFFFCPMRLITDHWEDFITGGQDGLSEVVLPYITPQRVRGELGVIPMQKGSQWDYMGLPVQEGAEPAIYSVEQLSALPLRAALQVHQDWFRDPTFDPEIDLHTELQGEITDSTQLAELLTLRVRGWERDYFTAALPFAQRGAEVLLPLSGTATGDDITYRATANYFTNDVPAGNPISGPAVFQEVGGPAGSNLMDANGDATTVHNIDSVEFSQSNITINDFRRSLAIQRWLENNARGGGRYIEQIQAHYNVRVPDYRLQRSEYLGGGRQPVIISEVLSTADTDAVPVGDMAGHGISVGKTNRFNYRCAEHGYIIGILSVVPRTAYSQGIDKMWTRRSKYDVAFPEFANLGEQEILSKEVFYSFDVLDDPDNNEVFGYIPRYAEYKFSQDRVAGDFRDNLAFWHLSRIFTVRPLLGNDFVAMHENAPTIEETYRRIFAVQEGADYLWMQLFHRLTCKRPLPYFGVPHLNG